MADPKIDSNRGWHQLNTTLGKAIPQKLQAAGNARQAMRQLTRGKKG
jgi:hypothetical protein